jgi:ketosteroid isomerase-like protein
MASEGSRGIEANKAIVVAFLGHYTAERYEEALALLGDDIRWWMPGRPGEFAAAGTVDRRELERRLRGTRARLPGGLDLRVVALTAEGDRVAAEVAGRGITSTGREYSNEYHFVFVVKGGLIRSVREYLDTLHAHLVFGVPAAEKPAG